ncbi:MAG: cytochrome C oxidase subunit IV family protein [Acidobacteriota bacterium]|nr:cytochrome C oxidase subunit IV family protein [Blastocatellia bacterium]MDW8413019.1 cytochrome C oxidase subunit IV family protein [Acidobacteriota bacterium]
MSEHRHHIMPVKGYLAVWAGLVVLTAVTVWVSYFNFGMLNVAVAIIVATIKAALVCLYFMHLKYDTLFNRVILLSTIVFVALFMGFTFIDINSRVKVEPSQFSDNSPLPLPAKFRGEEGKKEAGAVKN